MKAPWVAREEVEVHPSRIHSSRQIRHLVANFGLDSVCTTEELRGLLGQEVGLRR